MTEPETGVESASGSDATLPYELEVIEYPHSPTLRVEDLFKAARPGDFTVRSIIQNIPAALAEKCDYNLSVCLESIDQYFTRIASTIGASVAPHSWKLMTSTSLRARMLSDASLDNYGYGDLWLGASVSTLPGIIMPEHSKYRDQKLPETVSKPLHDTALEHERVFGWSIKDVCYADQFIAYGRNPTQLHLIDFDILSCG